MAIICGADGNNQENNFSNHNSNVHNNKRLNATAWNFVFDLGIMYVWSTWKAREQMYVPDDDDYDDDDNYDHDELQQMCEFNSRCLWLVINAFNISLLETQCIWRPTQWNAGSVVFLPCILVGQACICTVKVWRPWKKPPAAWLSVLCYAWLTCSCLHFGSVLN